MTSKLKKKSKRCTQTGCCFFSMCKYGHDQSKCRTSITFADSNKEVIEIS